MTLNFPPRSLFPPIRGPAADDLFPSIWTANGLLSSERNYGDCHGRFGNPFPGGAMEPGKEVSSLANYLHDDILNILPSDPFGIESYNSGCSSCSASSEMDHDDVFSESEIDFDLEVAALTAVSGWFEDLEGRSDGDLEGLVRMGSMIFGDDGLDAIEGDYQLFAGLNFLWDTAVRCQSPPGSSPVNAHSPSFGMDGLAFSEDFIDYGRGLHSLVSEGRNDGLLDDQCWIESLPSDCCRITETDECSAGPSNVDGGSPHEAIYFALGYLGLQDLLSVDGVCRSLHHAVQSDSLLWRRIHVGHPLSKRLTDDILVRLTDKAQGNLQCLTLVDCLGITDAGLKRVLESNPRLTKISIPGCARLTIEGVIDSLKSFKSFSDHGLKQLRLGDLYGMTHEQYEELLPLLDVDTGGASEVLKPQYYHLGCSPVSHDDGRKLDIEICPICENVRLVYDCPDEGCNTKRPADKACRACTFCIARCVHCGRCVKDGEYEETFSLDLLCPSCWWLLFEYGQEGDEGEEKQHMVESFYTRPGELKCSCSIYIG
ncbi:F-box protein [Nymphaea thermarum]|nr:F-box protein [Nymphaea thermarum]